MPELPEVETVRRGLAPVVEGAVIERADVRRPDLRFPFPERFADRLAGQCILALRRRAKYLLAELSGGETLIMHLGMSGSFRVEEETVRRRDLPPAPRQVGRARSCRTPPEKRRTHRLQ